MTLSNSKISLMVWNNSVKICTKLMHQEGGRRIFIHSPVFCFSLFSAMYSLLFRWMLILKITRVSNKDVSGFTRSLCEPNVQASGCSKPTDQSVEACFSSWKNNCFKIQKSTFQVIISKFRLANWNFREKNFKFKLLSLNFNITPNFVHGKKCLCGVFFFSPVERVPYFYCLKFWKKLKKWDSFRLFCTPGAQIVKSRIKIEEKNKVKIRFLLSCIIWHFWVVRSELPSDILVVFEHASCFIQTANALLCLKPASSLFLSSSVDIRAIWEYRREQFQRCSHGERRHTVKRAGLQPGIRQDPGGFNICLNSSRPNWSKDCLREKTHLWQCPYSCPHTDRTVWRVIHT